VWTYVVAINTSMPGTDRHANLSDALTLESLGIAGPRSVLDWRAGTVADKDRIDTTLAPRDWAFYVVAPADRRADEGDLRKYVTVPTQRP
jgi:hypothetical protein